MMAIPEIVIKVSNLSKMYKIYNKPADMFWELFTGKLSYKPFWALRDISFEVRRGQVVGVLGRNGAGKSTLLKIITGTLDKTAGEVQVNGRISSILELGTGFNMEYSGRDNIYLGGLMVGLTREEIKEKEDWIIEFSELRDFIDQPFKTYSSGMQARLTFSTAVCIDPDLLIIDEALSTGDARFARKSFGKIEEFQRAGNTILLVSHDINTINTFCDHAIILEHGRIFECGEPRHVSMVYYNLLFGEDATTEGVRSNSPETAVQLPKADQETDAKSILSQQQQEGEQERRALRETARQRLQDITESGNDKGLRTGAGTKAEVLDYGIRDQSGKRVTLLESGQEYDFFMVALFHEDVPNPIFGFLIRNLKGIDMYGIDTRRGDTRDPIIIRPYRRGELLEGRLHVTMWLTNGDYFLSAGIGIADGIPLDFRYDELVFTVARLPAIQHASVVNLQEQFSFDTLDPVLS
jgi:lipopolysaccharide transport system ATP-binding protein